jgi:hypothetical protein
MDNKQPTASEASATAGETKTEREFWLPRLITIVVTVFGVVYLIAIPFGGVNQNRRFGLVEALILIIVLVFNSGLIQRLESIAISDKGLSIQLQHLQNKQDKQQVLLRSVVEFLINNFLSRYEFRHLERLSEEGPMLFDKTYAFEAEIRRLRAIGFIQATKPGVEVNKLPKAGDLKDYFSITASGRAYLDFRKQFPPIDSA